MDTFNLKKLIEMEVREQFQLKISNRFAALERFFNGGNISRDWEHINPLKPELNPICYLLPLLGVHHFLHVSRIRVKLLTF